MSNYRTHVTFNLLFALPISAAGICYVQIPPTPYLLTFICAFFYSTCFLNPDLDLIHQIKIFSLRGIMTLPFRFYSKMFKHRGLSHSFLFGTATRVLWLSGLFLLLFYLIYNTLPTHRDFFYYLEEYKSYIIYACAGVVLADWSHLLLDLKKGE